jgi:hypothetical protein
MVVFGSDSEAILSHAAGVFGAFCPAAAPGTSTTVKTNTQRMAAPLVATDGLDDDDDTGRANIGDDHDA